MKALVLNRYQQLDYQDVPEPAIVPNEVLVEVRACGICGSDVHGFDGSTGRRRPPVIMGHEASGVVAQLGPHVSGWEVGQRVTFDSTIWCGECPACLELIARDTIRVAPLLSAVAPLAEGARWFDRLYRNQPGLMKVVLQP